MAADRVKQKPSETAFFAAFRRALAHTEYGNSSFGPDSLAHCFLPPHIRFLIKFKPVRSSIIRKLDALLPGLTEYMIARTAFFDELFTSALDQRIPQIVLLGAGYDTRAYRFENQNAGTRVFELDAAPTQTSKINSLKKARVPIPEHVTFIPIEFNGDALADALTHAGYRKDLKTLFLWEGVSYYLEAAAVQSTLRFVHSDAPPGSTIAFDYTVPISGDDSSRYYGASEFANAMRSNHPDESLLFSIADDQIASFLSESFLKTIAHLDSREIERTYLAISPEASIGPITGHFRFLVASPIA